MQPDFYPRVRKSNGNTVALTFPAAPEQAEAVSSIKSHLAVDQTRLAIVAQAKVAAPEDTCTVSEP